MTTHPRRLYDPIRTRAEILAAVAASRGWTVYRLRVWLGEIEPPSNVVSLRQAREAAGPRVEMPADCGDGGTAA